MNKTFTYLLLGSFCMSGWMGCIKEDFSDCPPPVNPPIEQNDGSVKLQLTYTLHTHQRNGAYIDRLMQEVHQTDVFVFNNEGDLVKHEKEAVPSDAVTPYTRTFHLPAGDYQVVVWGNHHEEESQCHMGPDVPLESGRMRLRQRVIPYLNDSLFHGITPQPFTVVAGEEQTVPVDLMKNRNDIRLLVRWHEKGTERGHYCSHASHFANLQARIIDSNGAYTFRNEPVRRDTFVYMGCDFEPAARYDSVFYGDTLPPLKDTFFKADFPMQRLMKESEARLQLYRGDTLVYQRRLLDVINRIEAYATQEALDREDHYLIELLFACEHPQGPVDPDDPDDPDDPVDPDDPDKPVDPDDPILPDPKPEEYWNLISISVNGWNFVESDIEL